jgi:hypothetical protein
MQVLIINDIDVCTCSQAERPPYSVEYHLTVTKVELMPVAVTSDN